jgi:hypothetical protein
VAEAGGDVRDEPPRLDYGRVDRSERSRVFRQLALGGVLGLALVGAASAYVDYTIRAFYFGGRRNRTAPPRALVPSTAPATSGIGVR